MATLILLFLLGLAFGSFANVCAWRIPRGESIVFPGSHCPACGAAIVWHRNVPLLSFALLRGRCADCRAPISWQYPAAELACGLLFLAQGMQFRGPALFLGLAFSFILLIISLIDFHHQIIPDVFSLGLLGMGLLAAPWNPGLGTGAPARLLGALGGAAAGFGVMFAMAWAGERIFKKEALGGGDVKLMAGVGAFVGWLGVAAALFAGSLLGTLAVILLFTRGRLKRGDYLPFGPFLALGAWIAWMGGTRLWLRLFSI